MAGKYSTHGAMALIAGDTVLSIIAATTVRPRLSDILLSSSSTPNDYTAGFLVSRFSADGTGTSVTPNPLDFNDPAAITTSKHTYTIEPTPIADSTLLDLAFNQRATIRWVAAPGFELVAPALAGDGLGILCEAVSTQFTTRATFLFEE